MTCAWCPKPATTQVEVQAARYRTVNGAKHLAQRAITAPACPEHAGITQRPRTPPPAQDPREPVRPGHHRRLPPMTAPDDQDIRRHDPLCRKIASRYYAPGLDRDDLIQEARIALLSAIETHDPARGPFGPFAALAIRRRLDTVIKTALRRKHQPLNRALSLDAPLPGSDEDAGTLHDILPAQAAPGPRLRDELHAIARQLDQRLSLLEAEAMRLVIFDGLPYQDAAAELGVTAKAIDNALGRLRRKAAAIAGKLGLDEDLAA